jgi:hypothetical protein
MKKLNISYFLLGLALLALPACNPKIYSFEVSPRSTGQNDPVSVRWKAKGNTFLLIHDINHPGSGTAKLHDLTLLVTLHGKELAYTLQSDDTVRIGVPSEDSLVVRRRPDAFNDDILRYFTLVATLHGKEVPSTVQVEVRMDSDSDAIAFVPKVVGDSLVAKDTNSSIRWGDSFAIQTVTTGSDRTLVVSHSNITRILNPGDKPDEAFKGTPVGGQWSFSTALTPEEKSGTKRTPAFLRINITIKHL